MVDEKYGKIYKSYSLLIGGKKMNRNTVDKRKKFPKKKAIIGSIIILIVNTMMIISMNHSLASNKSKFTVE